MSHNGQAHFKNLAANAAKFLKCVWLFWDIMNWSVNIGKYMLKVNDKHVWAASLNLAIVTLLWTLNRYSLVS